MGNYLDPNYKRDWMRRFRAAHPELQTIAGGRQSRAVKEKLKTGQCRACRRDYGRKTAEHFVVFKNKEKNWQGWSSECRECRNKRWRAWHEARAG